MAQTWTQQQLINSPCRTCFLRWQSSHSGTDTTHSSSANVLVSWYLVVTVTTSFGRDRRQRIRQDRCDDPKRPFMNVPSNSVNPCSGQLNYDLYTPAVNRVFSLTVYATRQQSRTPPARSDQFCFERITFLCCGPSPFLPLSIYVGSWTINRSQLRKCHAQRLSASDPKECKAYIN